MRLGLMITGAIVLWLLCGMYAARRMYVSKDRRRADIRHESRRHSEDRTIRECDACSDDIRAVLWLGVLAAVYFCIADLLKMLGWVLVWWTLTMERVVSGPTKREREENRWREPITIIENWGLCEKHGEASDQCTMCTVEASLCDHGEGGCTPTCMKVTPNLPALRSGGPTC